MTSPPTAPPPPQAPCLPRSWLSRYALGTLPDAALYAAEEHLDACDHCTGLVVHDVRQGPNGARLDGVHARVLATVAGERARRPLIDRALIDRPLIDRALGGRSLCDRALVALRAAPALRWSWAGALLAVCAAGVALAQLAKSRELGTDGLLPLLLMCAPLLPLLGVAMSYGPQADPFHEVAAVTPSGGLKLLLWRSGQVLAVCLPLLTLTGLLLPSGDGALNAAAWLLPALAMSLATLALGSWVGCGPAALATGGAWLLAVGVPLTARLAVREELRPAFGEAAQDALRPLMGTLAQGGWAAGALACCGVLYARRQSFEGAGARR
ncbi:zf-HC2 domain-containing protein [Streptomyces sp. NPDC041068]|uniref:zf-HC2 domain-containing protein n=1 Tax=Streptomyces sp. NPDC041068 TaxID=3155130 RepID=UPI0033C98712